MNPIQVVLLVLVILMVCGGLPPLQAYHSYGYAPLGGGTLLLIVLIVLLLRG